MSSNVGGSSCVDCTFLAGLKKVTNDIKTKNRGDRSGAIPASSAPTEKASAVDCQCVESHPVGPAYCPNPNEPDLVSKPTNQRMWILLSFAFHLVTLTLDERLPCMQPREFETHVQIFVRVPEMQEVEETRRKCVGRRAP